MARSDFPRLLSQPHRVFWAGWETRTTTLQQAGWEIAAEQDFVKWGVRLVMRHQQMQTVAITDSQDFHRVAMLNDPGRRWAAEDPRSYLLEFNVVRIAHDMAFQIEHLSYMPDFRLVDAQSQYCHRELRNIEDMGIFATPLVRTEELIVDESEVSAILAKLVQAQKPEQERIRDRQRLRDKREGLSIGHEPQMKFHAQILSIAA